MITLHCYKCGVILERGLCDWDFGSIFLYMEVNFPKT